MVATYLKKIMHNMMHVTRCIQGRKLSFSSVECHELVENINIRIYSDTINVINVKLCIMVLVKLCMMVLFIELYLFIPFSLTLTIIQGHSNVEHF